MNEDQIREIIRDELSNFVAIDRFIFQKNIQIIDGKNIQIGTDLGTSIGTGDAEKISVHGETPTARQNYISDPTGGTTVDSNARATIISILTALKNFGIIKKS